MPPSQAGMEPSLLPARSPPKGVSVVLSLAASSALTPAWTAALASSIASSREHAMVCFMGIASLMSERAGDGEGQVVAVLQALAEGEHAVGGAGERSREGRFLADVGGVGETEVPGVLV